MYRFVQKHGKKLLAVFSAAMESPVCAEYFKLMVMPETGDPGAGVLHFHRIREYAAS